MSVRNGTAMVIALLVGSTCHASAPGPSKLKLPEGAMALVGSDRIERESVERIASAQGITPELARDRAVFDALIASYARDHFGPDLSRHAQQSASARVLLQDLTHRAGDMGPPTDEEVAAATERRFWELDQPPLLRTTHAVVIVKKPEEDAPARALAERVQAAVASARDPATFRAAVAPIQPGGLELRVEDLDPVARDGRVLNPEKPPRAGSAPERYAADYVAAAYAIPEIGAKSPVTRTEFGYHVILAVERIPEKRTPLEERRRMLSPEILAARAEKLRDEVLTSARQRTPIEVERAAMELTEKVKAVQ